MTHIQFIALYLHNRMREKGITPHDLRDRTGFTRTTIDNLLNARTAVGRGNVALICQIIDGDAEYLNALCNRPDLLEMIESNPDIGGIRRGDKDAGEKQWVAYGAKHSRLEGRETMGVTPNVAMLGLARIRKELVAEERAGRKAANPRPPKERSCLKCGVPFVRTDKVIEPWRDGREYHLDCWSPVAEGDVI